MGLSCGNPTATANLKAGEVVVDLGSGGGLDVFLAAQKVGPTGKAIGIDMTPEMIALARKNAKASKIDNAEFYLAEIDHLPFADSSVDVVISNCVINLASDKHAVFREIARVLKPGGRVAVSDIALKKPLPLDLAKNLMAYVGCIAGAVEISEHESGLRLAGFVEPTIEGQVACCSPATSTSSLPIGADSSCCGTKPFETAIHTGLADLIRRYDVNAYAASVKVFAVKPIR
jgi:SAM-dependent methyltransferase